MNLNNRITELETELAAANAKLEEVRQAVKTDGSFGAVVEMLWGDDHEELAIAKRELDASRAQNERLLSLVRLQRGELHQKDAISDEEYATLAGDVGSRAVLNTHDTLRGEIAVLEKQLQKRDKALTASHARETQLRSAIESIEANGRPHGTCTSISYPDGCECAECEAYDSAMNALTLPPAPVVPLSLAESLAKALDFIAKWNLPKHYELDYGSSGVRDYIKGVAERALEAWRAAK